MSNDLVEEGQTTKRGRFFCGQAACLVKERALHEHDVCSIFKAELGLGLSQAFLEKENVGAVNACDRDVPSTTMPNRLVSVQYSVARADGYEPAVCSRCWIYVGASRSAGDAAPRVDG